MYYNCSFVSLRFILAAGRISALTHMKYVLRFNVIPIDSVNLSLKELKIRTYFSTQFWYTSCKRIVIHVM